MALVDIDIGGIIYKSYVGLGDANNYLKAEPALSAAWDALTDPQKNQYLVSATRHIDAVFLFVGKPTGGAVQDTSWPRTGATYYDGTEIADDAIPPAVANATALLAGMFAAGILSTASGSAPTNTNLSSVKAGSVAVEFRSDGRTATVTNTAHQSIDDSISPLFERLGLLANRGDNRSGSSSGYGVGGAYGTDECATVSELLYRVSVY